MQSVRDTLRKADDALREAGMLVDSPAAPANTEIPRRGISLSPGDDSTYIPLLSPRTLRTAFIEAQARPTAPALLSQSLNAQQQQQQQQLVDGQRGVKTQLWSSNTQPKGKRSTETTEFLSPQAMQILAKSRGMSLAGESANQTNTSNFSNSSETQDFLSPEGRQALRGNNSRGVAISHNMALFNSYSHTPTKSPPILPEWPRDVGGKYASSPVRRSTFGNASLNSTGYLDISSNIGTSNFFRSKHSTQTVTSTHQHVPRVILNKSGGGAVAGGWSVQPAEVSDVDRSVHADVVIQGDRTNQTRDVTEAVERETRNLRERLANDASIRAEMADRIRDLEGRLTASDSFRSELEKQLAELTDRAASGGILSDLERALESERDARSKAEGEADKARTEARERVADVEKQAGQVAGLIERIQQLEGERTRDSEEAWEAARAARRGAKEAAEKASVEKENLRVLLTKADRRCAMVEKQLQDAVAGINSGKVSHAWQLQKAHYEQTIAGLKSALRDTQALNDQAMIEVLSMRKQMEAGNQATTADEARGSQGPITRTKERFSSQLSANGGGDGAEADGYFKAGYSEMMS